MFYDILRLLLLFFYGAFMKQKICHISDISTSLCKEFVLQDDLESKDAFLIYVDNHCYAFINSCPHTGINLNWQKEQFFSLDGAYLQCSLHGALFEPDNGLCIYGPCLGQRLKSLDIVIENDIIYLAE